MLFIKNGIHMVAIREGSVINVKPNPKFVRDNVAYGAIMLNSTVVGVYPLENDERGYQSTVYDVFRDICKQINAGDKIIVIPNSYHFKSVDEYEAFKTMLDTYTNEELINLYYDGIRKVGI